MAAVEMFDVVRRAGLRDPGVDVRTSMKLKSACPAVPNHANAPTLDSGGGFGSPDPITPGIWPVSLASVQATEAPPEWPPA